MKRLLILLSMVASPACTATEPGRSRADEAGAIRPWTVVPLEYAVAADVADALARVWPDVRVVPDQRTNSLIVTCPTEAELRQAQECIARLDAPVGPVVGAK